MGKGSTRRPIEIPKDKFDSNWEQIFGMKKTKEQQPNKQDDSKKNK
jgi:hypothetical protein